MVSDLKDATSMHGVKKSKAPVSQLVNAEVNGGNRKAGTRLKFRY